MMSTPKPTSRFIYLTIILLLSLTFIINSKANEDSDDIEDLIALDEEEEEQSSPASDGTHHPKPSSEAELLTKAQRIVLELNNDNTQMAIDRNEFVLVLGYAPWCVRSAELMPRFAEAASSLNELKNPILMAKIDAERYPKVASNLGIKGYPTLLLFINATSQSYTGGFSSEEMVIWVRKKTGTPVIRINSIDEANDFLKKHSVFAAGLFDKFEGPDYEEFVDAATTDNEIQFVETSSPQIADILFPDVKSTNAFLGIVKSEPERYTLYEDAFTKDGILQFLNDNKFPLVTFLTEVNSAKVYSSDKLQVYVFAEADDFKKLLEPFQDAARKFKSKIMFVFIDIKDDNLAKPFLTLFGLEESEETLVTAFDYKSGAKYLLESDPTPARIEEFCSRLLKGTLPPFYKSQAIPDNKGADVLTVVGKTFDDLILRSSKNIVLEIHTPWCLSCETTSKQVEKLAKHFKGLENMVFAKIDASVNEHPKLEVDDYPTLLFYPGSNKSNPIKMPTKSSAKDLAILINKHLKAEAEAQDEQQIPKDEL
ncbi:protein disulfide isomerase-like 1-6 [Cynara cardunculus var. scolymus]|uniref:protein disulfide isomerase-like 1-6 n=1 Tax=Cynara cardunculus var. scolymus TaxID=59895 RepID=UPI000D62C6C0|nr:protein disulfide isomerase-like 1-6 [Cynara cardunculus var. scolymus]